MSFVYTTLFTDTFHRANENPLNPAVWTEVVSPLQIVNDECLPTTGESEGLADNGGTFTWPNNQWAQLQVDVNQFTGPEGSFDYASALLICRRSTVGGYVIEIDGPLGSNCNVIFFKIVNGVTTNFFVGTVNFPAGSVIRIECFGTTITGYANGNLLASVTDVSFASGPAAIELFYDTQVSDSQVSNFSGGLISQGGGSGGSSGSWLTVNLDNVLRGVRH